MAQMTAFTDEDLKRLKAFKWEWNMPVGEHMAFMRDNVSALLSRLEAADRLAEAAIECGVGKPLWNAYLASKGEH